MFRTFPVFSYGTPISAVCQDDVEPLGLFGVEQNRFAFDAIGGDLIDLRYLLCKDARLLQRDIRFCTL